MSASDSTDITLLVGYDQGMTPEFWAIVTVGIVVVGSHWSLHRDMAGLHERMAKLEGAMDGFTRGFSEGRRQP